MTFDPNTTVLLIMDPEVDMYAPDGAFSPMLGEQLAANNALANTIALQSAARAAGLPIAYAVVQYTDADYDAMTPRNPFEALMKQSRALRPGAGGEITPELAPQPGDIVPAPRRGIGMANSGLIEQLRARGTTHLILTGLVADLCLSSHVRDAFEAGFTTTVVSDTTAGTTPEAAQAALASFGLLAGSVQTTAETLEQLSATAGA